MSKIDDIRAMLKEHGISEVFYEKFRDKSKLDNDEFDDLALEYNAPLGKSWEEIAQQKYNYNDMQGLSENTVEKRNYHSIVRFGVACAVFLDNEEDELFFDKLPNTYQEYLNLSFEIKAKLMNIVKKQILHVEICENINIDLFGDGDALRNAREQSVESLISESKKQIEEFKNWREKEDFESLWKCALHCRKKICAGDFGTPTEDVAIIDGYRWGVENCTVRGKPIEDEYDLVDGYDNGKRKKKSRYIIMRFEEDNYD